MFDNIGFDQKRLSIEFDKFTKNFISLNENFKNMYNYLNLNVIRDNTSLLLRNNKIIDRKENKKFEIKLDQKTLDENKMNSFILHKIKDAKK